MTRSHGRCARGERLRMGFPHGHRKTTTLVAGLRMTGMVAPMVLDGPINGDWFEAYVTQILAPELRPGDVVIMDNLSSHKRDAVRERIEAVGATLRSTPKGRTAFCAASAPKTLADMPSLLGGPHHLANEAIGAAGALIAVANSAGPESNIIHPLRHS
ncbi:MAG TPA: transposase [Acidiphilium sp.]|nr:transposase [Acidiphilium sp.]